MKRSEAEARDWLLKVKSGDLSDAQQEALADWLCQSSENLAAYKQCEALWGNLGTLGTTEEGNSLRQVNKQSHLSVWRRFWQKAQGDWLGVRPGLAASGLAAAASLMIGVLVFVLWGQQTTDFDSQFETDIAQTATHELDDGTRITLSARSEVNVRMSDSARRVDIISGRVFFDVARDPQRPFAVYAHDARVEVLGTEFDVQRTEKRVKVSVREGIVALSDAESAQPKVTLEAGERVTKPRQQPVHEVEPIALDEVNAWMKGRLVYRSAPLEDVVEEVNRYSEQNVKLVSPDLAALELTASLDINDLDDFPTLLSQSLPVRVQRGSTGEYLVFSR